MKLQTKPNPWSCVGSAFAMVLDMSVAKFFGHVGHDGSQIAFPMLPDPMSRRGLHIQECIAACLKLGYAVTPVELFPVIRPTSNNGHKPCRNLVVLFGDDEPANWHRFEETIKTSTGVLEGVGHRCLHAVAYDHGMIFDPDGAHYPYSRSACESRGFHPRRAWRVDRRSTLPANALSQNSLEPIPTIPKDSPMKLPYDHGLTNKITQSSDNEQNRVLYPRVMAGDDKAREEMIESNMPLVISKVDSYLREYSQLEHLRDDLHSAGFIGLVQAVAKMAEHKEPLRINPTGYISVAITNGIVRLAKKEAVHIGIELADARAIDTEIEGDVSEVSHDIPESIVDTNQSTSPHQLELRELLESCCQNEEERTLLRMREEGHTDREIAESLNAPRIYVHRLRKELEERFNQKCRELEE